MIHVGISGKIASGKSTLAKTLKQLSILSGYACEIVPFAYGVREVAALEQDPVRRATLVNLFYSWGYDYGTSIRAAMLTDKYMEQYPSEEGKKNRRLLQAIGTEVGRVSVAEDIWIRRTHAVFNTLSFLHGRMLDFGISDDVRFDNEALACDVHVGIHVEATYEGYRDWKIRIGKFGAEYSFSEHASEHSLTLPPLLTIPGNFTQSDVLWLFEKLDAVRKLRT